MKTSSIAFACLISFAGLVAAQTPEPVHPDFSDQDPLKPYDPAEFRRSLPQGLTGAQRGPDGAIRGYLGQFDVRVSPRLIEDDPDAALARGIRQFLGDRQDELGFADGVTGLLYVGPARRARDGQVLLTDAHLVHERLRLLGTAFDCVFARDGALLACNGNLPGKDLALDQLPEVPEARAAEVVAAALAQVRIGVDEDWEALTRTEAQGRQLWFGQSGEGMLRAERLIDAETMAILWKIETGEQAVIYDEATGQVLETRSLSDEVHDWLPVRHRRPTATNFGASTGVTQRAQTERIGTFGSMRINALQYGKHAGWDWALTRVDDNNSAEVASIAAPPTLSGGFPSNIGSALRQQTVFFWAWRARAHFRWGAWNIHAPNKTNMLDLLVDEPDKCNNAACFKDWGIVNDPGLYFDVSEGAALNPQTIVHEFGHYVVWTYGDVDNGCKKGKDESDAIDESVADVISALVFHRLFGSSGIQTPFQGNNGWNPGNALYPRSFASSNCSQPVWNFGRPFEEAMWEALHGVDCEARGAANCAALSNAGNATPFGDFGWTGRVNANASLTRALAFSLDVTGDEPTFSNLRFWIFFDLLMNGQITQAQKWIKVAAFHGF